MIDNIVANHLLLSDYRLERWLLRYSQKSADGGGGGGGGNSGSLVAKRIHTSIQPPASRNIHPMWQTIHLHIPPRSHQHLLLHQRL